MRRLLIFVSVVLVALSSCTVEENYTFNNDFSGTFQANIDLSGYLSNNSEPEEMQSLLDSIKTQGDDGVAYLGGIQGIAAPKYTFDKANGILAFSFRFNNLQNLNALVKTAYDDGRLDFDEYEPESATALEVPDDEVAGPNEDAVAEEDNPSFYEFSATSPKVFTFKLNNAPPAEAMDYAMSTDMFVYKITMHFPSKIKRVSHPNAEIQADGQSFTIEKKMLYLPQNSITVELF